jgi:hypothetical protein
MEYSRSTRYQISLSLDVVLPRIQWIFATQFYSVGSVPSPEINITTATIHEVLNTITCVWLGTLAFQKNHGTDAILRCGMP